jgi:hypothetical protein
VRRSPAGALPLVLAFAAVSAACGGGSSMSRAFSPSAPHAAIPVAASGSPTAPSVPPTTTTEPEEPGWTPVAYVGSAIAVDERSLTLSDGVTVTLARFRAREVAFDLHVGSQDPPANLSALPADAQPAVSVAEAPVLLAAFNGGFKTSAQAGGMLVGGQTLVPLVDGLASFVIDTDGTGHVGVWGQSLPMPGETVSSVRQNLGLLVTNSEPSPAAYGLAAWGSTLGGRSMVARSALGEDAKGNIVYAGSMSALPIDMANALVGGGVTTAMELDINPEWVQLALAPAPGASLEQGVPGQNRPANQTLIGWTRDFTAVLAAPHLPSIPRIRP